MKEFKVAFLIPIIICCLFGKVTAIKLSVIYNPSLIYNSLYQGYGEFVDIKKVKEFIGPLSGVNLDNTFSYNLKDDAGKEIGFLKYEYLGTWKECEVLYIIHHEGGSGVFSSISMYEVKDGRLFHKNIVSGDRHLGGITKPLMVGNKIYYCQYLSESDLYSLAGIPEKENKYPVATYSVIARYSHDLCSNISILERMTIVSDDYSEQKTKCAIILRKMSLDHKTVLNQNDIQVLFTKLRQVHKENKSKL